MKLELTQRQTTGLFMTTEVRQAISLLQYSSMEVWDYVQEEMLNNPLLTIEERSFGDTYVPNRRHQAGDSMMNRLESYPGNGKGWREELFDQIKWQMVRQEERRVMHYLILNLNERGFLPMEENEIAAEMKVSQSFVKVTLECLKNYESKGLGCFNTKEYLLFQIKQKHPDKSLLVKLAAYHLDELANRRWNELAKTLGVSQADIKAAFAIIKKLQPHPYIESMKQPVKYMIPDLIVKKDGARYLLSDPNSLLSSIDVDASYPNLSKDSQAETFINDCYKKADWLIRSIEQRRQTILKVAKVIVYEQTSFLQGGALKPLTYKQVADKIGVHESTVSRAVANKVMQTPKGTYELRFFFTTGISQNQSTISSNQVKEFIKDFIDEEDRSRPLSDQKLADLLQKDHGVEISRRTVAKYRESLDIPSSSKRKE